MAKATIFCRLCILLLLLSLTHVTNADEIWKAQSPMYVIVSGNTGWKFYQELIKSGISSGYLGGYQLDYGIEKYIDSIKRSNSIIIVTPLLADFDSLKKVEQKHPDLLPIACNELLFYPTPFMYFSYDKAGRVRGLIISEKLPENFAKFLINNGVPLKKAFWYENGEIKYLQKLTNPRDPESYIPSGWKLLKGEHFNVLYRKNYVEDARKMLNYAEEARNIVMSVYPHNISGKITIYLHTLENYDRPPHVAYSESGKNIIHFLTPSENPRYDDVWYRANMIHEYAHIPFYDDLYSKDEGYKKVPEWFSEGFAEYCKVFASKDKQILDRYQNELYKIKEMVKNGEGYLMFVCEDGGAYITKYIYKTYNQERFIRLIKSSEPTFAKAMEKELGVTPREFEDNWLKWACREFGADPKIYNLE